MEVREVEKWELEPGQWGVCVRYKGVVIGFRILRTLPKCVKDFLTDHELHHATDTLEEGWIEREIEANWSSFCKHPIGAIVTLWLSIWNKERRGYYVRRFKEGK